MWAHAEYMKLLRSVDDGVVYDRVPEVFDRYITNRGKQKRVDVWKADRRVRSIARGADAPFRLRWSNDGWSTHTDSTSSANRLQIDFVDIDATASLREGDAIDFTFFWTADERWDGRNHRLLVGTYP